MSSIFDMGGWCAAIDRDGAGYVVVLVDGWGKEHDRCPAAHLTVREAEGCAEARNAAMRATA